MLLALLASFQRFSFGSLELSEFVFVIDNQWRMVRKSVIGKDRGLLGTRGNRGGCNLVIDTPTHVLGPGLTSI
jgi:hypothetical protein